MKMPREIWLDCEDHGVRYSNDTEMEKYLGKAVSYTRTDLIEPLVEALREIREIYAGMEGFIAETCPEGYLQEIVSKMAAVSMEALAAFEQEDNDA